MTLFESVPQFDMSVVVAVQSRYQNRAILDPWAQKVEDDFADLFVWSDKTNYIVPVSQDVRDVGDGHETYKLINELKRRDKDSLERKDLLFTHEQILEQNKWAGALSALRGWCRKNKKDLPTWVQLHEQDWVRKGHDARVGGRYVYDVEFMKNQVKSEFDQACREAGGLSIEQFSYIFDMALRYLLYGAQVGENGYYLSHPLRNDPNFGVIKNENKRLPWVPFSIANCIKAEAKDFDQYTVMLHKARGIVRQLKLTEVERGEKVPVEAKKDFAYKMGLKAELIVPEVIDKWLPDVAASIIDIFSEGRIGNLARIGVSISKDALKNHPPKFPAKIKWLRYKLYRFPTIEKEMERSQKNEENQ